MGLGVVIHPTRREMGINYYLKIDSIPHLHRGHEAHTTGILIAQSQGEDNCMLQGSLHQEDIVGGPEGCKVHVPSAIRPTALQTALNRGKTYGMIKSAGAPGSNRFFF